jgi:hypothetical protein
VRGFELGSAQLALALLQLGLVVVLYLVQDYVLGLFYVNLGAYRLTLFTHLVYLIPLLLMHDVPAREVLELVDFRLVQADLFLVCFPEVVELGVVLSLQL